MRVGKSVILVLLFASLVRSLFNVFPFNSQIDRMRIKVLLLPVLMQVRIYFINVRSLSSYVSHNLFGKRQSRWSTTKATAKLFGKQASSKCW
jgi:hypothetical protein